MGRRGRVAATAGATLLGSYLGALTVDRARIQVAGPSMTPTLWPDDVLLCVPPLPGLLRVGAVVVVEDPEEPGHLVVKRVSALDGNRLQVLGDDPAHSTDSRRWGWLPRRAVRRVALCRWPDVRTPLWRAVPGPEPVPPLPPRPSTPGS